jgi:hypothetical protein
VPGDHIDEHFKDKKVGGFDCYVQEMEGTKFLVHCHKEDGYIQKVMSTHGLMVEMGIRKTTQRKHGVF